MQETLLNTYRIRILAVIPNLSGGGAERAVLRLIKVIDTDRFKLKIFAHEKWGALVDELDSESPIEFGRPGPYQRSSLPLLFLKTLKKSASADIILGANEGRATFFALISGLVLRKPVVSWIHNNWSEFGKHVSWKQRFALRMTVMLSRKIVACSQGVADDLVDNHKVPVEKVTRIYHGLPSQEIKTLACKPIDTSHEELFEKPVVVTAGRLDPQKGQEYLIESHALLVEQGLDHNLLILGEGDRLGFLKDCAVANGVEQSVHFLGFRKNPFAYIARARVFALSSKFEGFGLVLAEAQLCGTAVVSTDCPSGPSEILGGGKYGLLATNESPTSLASCIGRLLRSNKDREFYARAAGQRGLEFDQETAVKHWESLFESLSGAHASPDNP